MREAFCHKGCGRIHLQPDTSLVDHLRTIHHVDLEDPDREEAQLRAVTAAAAESELAQAGYNEILANWSQEAAVANARAIRARLHGHDASNPDAPAGECADCGIESLSRWVVGRVGATCFTCTTKRRRAEKQTDEYRRSA